MMSRLMHALPALALAAGCFAAAPAKAADVVVRVPAYAGVPRVRPSSPVKRYPFGVLREDYTPYGMPGVPDRIYFTSRARDLAH